MATIQFYFSKFHEDIKLKNTEENAILKSKREIIIKKLREKISVDAPSFTITNQGSYAMKTGVKPLDGDYDIDVALLFEMSKDQFKPVEAKKWVYDALVGHTKEVKVKVPCVTVTYQKDEEPVFHVDLTVYANVNSDNETYIAKGKINSLEQNKYWEMSNPKRLINEIENRFTSGDERDQFRRIIRYLKRWKDIHFKEKGSGKPSGIVFTACAMQYMTLYIKDAFTGEKAINDLQALISLLEKILNNFTLNFNINTNQNEERLKISLPVPPGNDLLEKMTNIQMSNFKAKLESLLDVLKEVNTEPDIIEATKLLNSVFGDSFPVATNEETAVAKRLAIATDSPSAKL
ncbi:nucleotidyltransferase domain-containing protein [Bacillus paranthracis]|uniref:nucleotidyltransferase domain-containing protein n=1 Tax=Bacillus paranthracis TaxID=2026186 RepID=UPI002813E501|nr:nucleotidyltransferase [Bacillus paranthracis]MDR0167034.1 nucleotidyltransferase [Bacillus paranthracis]